MGILKNFAACTPLEQAMILAIILIPILVIIVAIVAIVRSRKNKKAIAEEAAVVSEEPYPYEPAPAPAPVAVVNDGYMEDDRKDKKSRKARKHQNNGRTVDVVVRREVVKTRICVKKLSKLDKSLLAATGIFCVGLGAMIQRAISGNR